MGGSTFVVAANGKTAKEAFDAAREEALYEYGHRGYTGTIAEKHSFVMVQLPHIEDLAKDQREWSVEKRARDYADRLNDEGDPRIDDKWGPAGCIALGDDRWLFFGWASS